MRRRARECAPAQADQGCTGPRRILSRTTRPCLWSSRWPRNDREVSRSAPPPRIRSTALAAAAIAAEAVRWGPVMGRRPRVDGRARAVHRRSVDGRTMDEARMAPAMPAGGPAPSESATPRKAALVPAWAAPGRIVPAVPPAAPNELRLFDRRGLRERRWRRERADAQGGLGGNSELGDQSRHGER